MRPVRKPHWEDAYSIIEPQISAAGIHVWPFDQQFPIDVRYLAMRRDAGIRMNRHNYCELLYLHSGEITYQVENRSYPMKEGDLFVISGTLPHRIANYGKSQVHAVVLYFLPDLIRAHDPSGEDAEYLMPFLVQDSTFPHVVLAKTGLPRQVFDLIQRAQAELPGKFNRSRLSVRTYLKMILVLLVNHYAKFRSSAPVFSQKQRNLDRLQPVFDLVDKRYADQITVDDAAASIHMSKSHFMRFFRQATGQPFVVFLNQFRVAKAQKILATTDHSIAEVGQEAGFCNQSYFGLVFRRLTSLTPREYKQRLDNGGVDPVNREAENRKIRARHGRR